MVTGPEPTNSNGVVTLGLSVGSILSAAPFGIPLTTIALATCFAAIGVIGRAMFEIQKSFDNGSKIKLSQTFGWLGAGLLGAPFTAIVIIVGLKTVGAQTDAMTAIAVLLGGFLGPRGIIWAWAIIANFIQKRTGIKPPTLEDPDDKGHG